MMNYRGLIFAAALLCVVAAPCRGDERPNFVVIIGDDISWEDFGCYGHPHIRTPNIDQLAKEGLRFDNAFLTCSSCSPSRASIVTGLYPHSTGAAELHQPLPAEKIIFPELLKKAGYYTAAAGKWHLGPHAKRGFEVIHEGGQPSGCEFWLKTVKERPRDKPFFLWLASFDAHRDYAKKIIPQPHARNDVVVPPFLPDNAETRADLALYYDEIARFDDYVGRVLKELEAQGAAENTFVLVMADNGRPFPRCKTTVYDSGVRTPFIIRWPKKIKPEGVTKSLVSSVDLAPTILELAAVKTDDIFQGFSFASLFEQPQEELRDFAFSEHNWHDYQAHERGVRSPKYQYVRNWYPQLTASPPGDAVRSITFQQMIKLEDAGKLPATQRQCFATPRSEEEFFDLEKDPHALVNVAKEPAYAEELARHRQALDDFMKDTDDKVPEKPTPDKYDRRTGKLPVK